MVLTIRCRICGGVTFTAIDLGSHPFANNLLKTPDQEINTYPLALLICKECSAAQLSYCADAAELYDNYLYITPDSTALKVHYQKIVDFLSQNGYLKKTSNVLEIGSNIGRFLEFIKPQVGSVVGVEPAQNICEMARSRGIPTVDSFFNGETARDIRKIHQKKDLIVARHCFAHNERPHSMLEGVQKMLVDNGVLVIENAYFVDTIVNREFDQIYHEHMYYYTVRSISKILHIYNFQLVDVYHSAIHGGTMVYVAKFVDKAKVVDKRIDPFLKEETEMHTKEYYEPFTKQIQDNKEKLLKLLTDLKAKGKTVQAYGASAKSSTLLSYFGITNEIIPCVVDSTITKHGKYIPLVKIKVISEEEAQQGPPPDYYLLTIWNYKDEIIKKVRESGNTHTKFIMPHPQIEVIE